MTFTVPDTKPEPVEGLTLTDQKATITKARPDPDAYHTELQARLVEAEKELARDQKALAAAEAKVADLKADVEFDGWKVGSRTKEIAEFNRLRTKAGR